MVNPETILDGLSAQLEAGTPLSTVLTEQVDFEGTGAAISVPFGELQFVSSIRSDEFNTDRVGWVTDNNGNRIGRLFEATFESSLQLDVYVFAGDDTTDATSLGHSTQRYLRRYDSSEFDKPLPDSNGNPIDAVEEFGVGEGRREDDLTGQPGIRRWRQDLSLTFGDVIDTTAEYGEEADYIATIDTAAAGDMTAGDGDDVAIEYVPA